MLVDFRQSIPWAKMLYTGLLLFLIVVFFGEVLRLWFDQRVYIGSFEYIDDGQSDVAHAASFRRQVLQNHELLTAMLSREWERRQREAGEPQTQVRASRPDIGILPIDVPPVDDPQNALSDLQLTLQGINFGQLLSGLRRWVSQPNELTGTVHVVQETVTVVASWPQGPSEARGDLVTAQHFHLNAVNDNADGAFQIACSLIWAQAARHQERLSRVTRDDFCAWATAWRDYRVFMDRSMSARGVVPDDSRLLESAREILESLVAANTSYAEAHRLLADTIEAATNGQPGFEETRHIEQLRAAYRQSISNTLDDQIRVAVNAPRSPLTTTSSDAVDAVVSSVDLVAHVLPGQRVSSSNGSSYVTVTAVLRNSDGERFLLIPDFGNAIWNEGDPAFVADQNGGYEPIGYFRDLDEEDGIALIALESGVRAENTLPDGSSLTSTSAAELGQHLRLVMADVSELQATVQRVQVVLGNQHGEFLEVAPAVSQPGSGGAPILDAEGRLVAMAHSTGPANSYFLTLSDVLSRRGLELAT